MIAFISPFSLLFHSTFLLLSFTFTQIGDRKRMAALIRRKLYVVHLCLPQGLPLLPVCIYEIRALIINSPSLKLAGGGGLFLENK